MRFRSKVVEIEAFRLGDGEEPRWWVDACLAGSARTYCSTPSGGPDSAEIRTLEGLMTANPGDYIIRGLRGELYPCKPDIFAMKYEAV
jgi:hypothetical protein